VATKVAIRSAGYVATSQKTNLQKPLIFSNKENYPAKVTIIGYLTLYGVIIDIYPFKWQLEQKITTKYFFMRK
jgi:hypothetical protein